MGDLIDLTLHTRPFSWNVKGLGMRVQAYETRMLTKPVKPDWTNQLDRSVDDKALTKTIRSKI